MLACFVVILLLSTLLSAQINEEELSTKGLSNGRAWNLLDDQSKITFLIGISEGIALFAKETQTTKETDQNLIRSLSKELTISGFRFSDLVQQVDKFYEDRSNIRIPIVYA